MTRKDYFKGIDNIKAGYHKYIAALNEHNNVVSVREEVEKTVAEFIAYFGIEKKEEESARLTARIAAYKTVHDEEAKKREEEAKKEGKKVEKEHEFKVTESAVKSFIEKDIFKGIDWKAKLEKEKKVKKEKTEEELQLIHENRQAKQLMKASTEALLAELKRRQEEEKNSMIVTNKSVIA